MPFLQLYQKLRKHLLPLYELSKEGKKRERSKCKYL